MYSNAFALAGRTSSLHHTQGAALGYVLVAPSGRALNTCAYSLIQLTKLEYTILYFSYDDVFFRFIALKRMMPSERRWWEAYDLDFKSLLL